MCINKPCENLDWKVQFHQRCEILEQPPISKNGEKTNFKMEFDQFIKAITWCGLGKSRGDVAVWLHCHFRPCHRSSNQGLFKVFEPTLPLYAQWQISSSHLPLAPPLPTTATIPTISSCRTGGESSQATPASLARLCWELASAKLSSSGQVDSSSVLNPFRCSLPALPLLLFPVEHGFPCSLARAEEEWFWSSPCTWDSGDSSSGGQRKRHVAEGRMGEGACSWTQRGKEGVPKEGREDSYKGKLKKKAPPVAPKVWSACLSAGKGNWGRSCKHQYSASCCFCTLLYKILDPLMDVVHAISRDWTHWSRRSLPFLCPHVS